MKEIKHISKGEIIQVSNIHHWPFTQFGLKNNNYNLWRLSWNHTEHFYKKNSPTLSTSRWITIWQGTWRNGG